MKQLPSILRLFGVRSRVPRAIRTALDHAWFPVLVCRRAKDLEAGRRARAKRLRDLVRCLDVAASYRFRGALAVDRLDDESRRLFFYFRAAVQELELLNDANNVPALRALGYALHVVPGLIEERGTLSVQMHLAHVTAHWSRLSMSYRRALAEVAGQQLEELDRETMALAPIVARTGSPSLRHSPAFASDASDSGEVLDEAAVAEHARASD